jgi:hypothetical protein
MRGRPELGIQRAQPLRMEMAQEGQAPAQAPQPVHNRAESSSGTPKGSSCSSSLRGQAAAAGQTPEPLSQKFGSQRVKSTSAFLFTSLYIRLRI